MKFIKLYFLFFFLLILSLDIVSAENFISLKNETTIHYFYGFGCPHCAKVDASGVIERLEKNFSVTKYEVYNNAENALLLRIYFDKFKLSSRSQGIPFLVIECHGNLSYISSDDAIINNAEVKSQKCENFYFKEETSSTGKITLTAIVIAALIDSINPCAFSVLIFLLVAFMAIGSRKKVLKAGLLYSVIVYITYFLAGIGIFKAVHSLTALTYWVYVASGVLILAAGVIELKDFFWSGGLSLKIPEFVKPRIEAIARKGTFPAIILLGFFVSLVELPCTGGIYLAILTLMSINKTFAIPYLLLYNFIFILPLLIITFVVYKGASPEIIEKWRTKGKKWMRLAAGVIMLVLGIYILWKSLI